MRIICAPDSFKGSMTAPDAAAALRRGVLMACPTADCLEVPVADGGEGTGQILTAHLGGSLISVPTTDPLGRPISAEFGWVPEKKLAIIEIAEAAGLGLVAPADRDPFAASTFGVGELIKAALDLGANRIILGLGGSATTDAGAGLFAALGVRFLDVNGDDLPPGGAALARLSRIDVSGLDARLPSCHIDLACDVTNPLLGPQGAAAVFGPQKGAAPAEVAALEAGLTRWAQVVEKDLGRTVTDQAGSGAAGGLGAAFLAFTSAKIRSGIDLVLAAINFPQLLAGANFVFTGEGSLDTQTLSGKVPLGVARVANAHGVPTIVFAGRVKAAVADWPFLACVPITDDSTDLAQALAAGPSNLEAAAARWTLKLLNQNRRLPR